MKEPLRLDDQVLTGGQPSAADLAALKALGVTTVINLRAADESNSILSPEEESEAAARLELDYEHIPVKTAALAEESVAAVRAAIDKSAGQVFLHCAAGQRAVALGLLARAAATNTSAEEIFGEAESKGVTFPDPKLRSFIESVRASAG